MNEDRITKNCKTCGQEFTGDMTATPERCGDCAADYPVRIIDMPDGTQLHVARWLTGLGPGGTW